MQFKTLLSPVPLAVVLLLTPIRIEFWRYRLSNERMEKRRQTSIKGPSCISHSQRSDDNVEFRAKHLVASSIPRSKAKGTLSRVMKMWIVMKLKFSLNYAPVRIF
jgi:hypothetical protein